jgi:hypothetical protein
VSIKLYPDADGRVGRIEVFGRDGGQLGILDRGATGFAIRPGVAGGAARFTAVALRISPQEAERDRGFVRQAFTAQAVGRRINIEHRNLRQQQRNQQRPNQQRPGRFGPGQRGGLQPRPGQFGRPGGPTIQRPGGVPGQRRPPPRRGRSGDRR